MGLCASIYGPSVAADHSRDRAVLQRTRYNDCDWLLLHPMMTKAEASRYHVGTVLSGYVTAEDNKPPRQCDHCRWYRSGDKCVHPVMKVIRKFPSTKTDPPRCWTMLAAISLNRPRGINDRTRPAYELSRPISI